MSYNNGNKILKEKFSQLSFLLYFPGFFIYQNAVAKGSIDYEIGYVSLLTTIILPSFILLYIIFPDKSLRFNIIDKAYLFIVLYCLLWGFMLSLFSINSLSSRTALSGIIISVSLYFVMRNMRINNENIPIIPLISFAFIFIVFVTNIEQGVFALGINNNINSTYQDFAVFFMIVGLIIVIWAKGILKFIFFLMMIWGLFINGARTELGIFLFVMIGMLYYFKSYYGAIAVLSFVFMYLYYYNIIINIEGNRIVDLIVNLAEGTRADRLVNLKRAISTISRSPLIGDFASYPPGSYAHNMLSIWVDYGVIGFILYISVIALILYTAFAYYKGCKSNKMLLMSMLLFIGCVFAEILTKSGFYFLTSIAIGALSQQVDSVQMSLISQDLISRSLLQESAVKK